MEMLARAHAVPSNATAVWTLAGITLKRLGRGKAPWIGAGIAALPLVLAFVGRSRPALVSPMVLLQLEMVILALLSAMFVATSIGEELDDRTSTYLWSRPIARWAVLAGKLCALTPIVAALLVASWGAAIGLATGVAPPLASCLALATGAVAASLVAAGIATVMPRYGMAMTIGYVLVDTFIGLLPFSAREISIAHQTTVLANLDGEPHTLAMPLITMAVISGLWAAVGFVRIRRLEV